jgi:phage baseplate assembly protein V
MIRAFHKFVAPLKRGLQLMVGRAVIKAVADDPRMQTAQLELLDGEVRDGVEVFQHYGFSSVPLAESEAIVVSVGGNRDHGIVVAHGDRRSRPTGLEAGDVAVYHNEGHLIVLKANGLIEMTAATQVRITAPTLEVTAETKIRFDTPLLEVTGDIKDRCDGAGRTMQSMRDIYNEHDHIDPQGGVVEPTESQM